MIANSNNESSVLLNAASLAVFVGVTALSQWMMNNSRRDKLPEKVLSFQETALPDVQQQDEQVELPRMQGEADAAWEDIYRQRRRERLSFHESSEKTNSEYWTDTEDGSSTSSDDAPLRQLQSNWSHFERYYQQENSTLVSKTAIDTNNNDSKGCDLRSNHSTRERTKTSVPIVHSHSQNQNRLKVHATAIHTDTALCQTDTNPAANLPHTNVSGHISIHLQNRAARTHYNAQIMPQKVILLRHGQSMGNMNENYYASMPDNAMPLTELGWKQARTAGKHLKDQLLGKQADNVHFIISPYVRTVETFHGIVSAWCDPDEEFGHIVDRKARRRAWYSRLVELGLSWREDPRIREQDFGNYQTPSVVKQCKEERAQFGAFYFRFPNGESGADVFDRSSTFLDSLWRSFDIHKSRHYVLITHGIAIRVLLTRYFRYTIDQFHLLANPKNCEMVVLEHDQQGRLILSGRQELKDRTENEEERLGYEFFPRLRVLPDEFVRTAKCRLSYDDPL